MKKQNSDHCKAEDNGKTLHCLNCGVKYEANLPMPLALYADLLKGFAKLHKNCEAPEAESK